MAHKYLNQIGVRNKSVAMPRTDQIDGCGRQARFLRQRREYGFDERETWALNYTSALWLYEHLKMYLDVCNVDLTFERFSVPVLEEILEEELVYREEGDVLPKAFFRTKTQKLTMGEAIKLCAQYLEGYIREEECPSLVEKVVEKEKRMEMCRNAFRVYAELLPAMWW